MQGGFFPEEPTLHGFVVLAQINIVALRALGKLRRLRIRRLGNYDAGHVGRCAFDPSIVDTLDNVVVGLSALDSAVGIGG